MLKQKLKTRKDEVFELKQQNKALTKERNELKTKLRKTNSQYKRSRGVQDDYDKLLEQFDKSEYVRKQ